MFLHIVDAGVRPVPEECVDVQRPFSMTAHHQRREQCCVR